MQAQGLVSELDEWVVTSTEHAYASWKVMVEYLRLAAYISGYEWWVFYGWSFAEGYGLVSLTFQPKGHALAPQRIRNFVSPVVVLLGNGSLWKPSPIGNSGEHGYLSGESIAPEVSVSNYAPNDLSGCTVTWIVQTDASPTGATAAHNGSFGVVGAIEQGTVTQVGAFSFSLDVIKPTRFRLAVELHCDTTTLPQPRPNDWTAWVYPPQPKPVISPVPIFASQPLLGLLAELGVVPHLQPMPLAGKSLPAKAVYLVQQDALAEPALVAAIHAGATALLISYNHSGPHAVQSSIMPPMPAQNVIYHSPMWTQTTHTPASLIVNKANTTPAALKALATPSGWADTAFFEVFGPKQGRCGNFRWGKQWDITLPYLPPGDKCRNVEYPVDRKDGLCWRTSNRNHHQCGDWCVQNTSRCSPPNAPCGCGCPGPDCFLRCCEISCPTAFPFPIQSSLGAGGNRGVLCYNDSKYIVRGGGPCGSWCTRDPNVGGGCGNASKLCPEVAKQCKSAPSVIASDRSSATSNINVWMRVVSTANNGQPVQNMAAVFERSIGAGHLIVSGLDLDLQSCSTSSERAGPLSVFAKWVAKTLIQAAVDSEPSLAHSVAKTDDVDGTASTVYKPDS